MSSTGEFVKFPVVEIDLHFKKSLSFGKNQAEQIDSLQRQVENKRNNPCNSTQLSWHFGLT